MASARRIGTEDSATRAALIDAALKLMVEEGYAAVTSRKVAAKAGLKPQLVHYYFRTMDDLFLALLRRGAERNLERQARALASEQPLRALWELSADRAGTTLTQEFSALANHRKAIRAEYAAYAEDFRRQQEKVLAPVLEAHGVEPTTLPADAVAALITAVSRLLVLEAQIGVTRGHAAIQALVEELLTRYEGKAPSARGRAARAATSRRSGGGSRR
jgi:AcrR family transcriptional regulator